MKRLLCVVVLLVAALSLASAAAEKVLTVASLADSMDPASQGSGTFPHLSLLYENLVRYKAASTDLEPWLAKSWTVSKDGLSVTFLLRSGVQFQRGFGEFTAEDVKFSIERIVNEKLAEAGEWANLDRVDVVDKYTVKLVMKSPTPTLFTTGLPFQAGMILSKKAVERLGAAAFNKYPVGTGPYELDTWEVGQTITYKPFAKYWGKRTLNADRVVFLSPSDLMTTMDAGDLDIFYAFDAKAFDSATKSPKTTYAGKYMRYWWVSLPAKDPVLANPDARRAFRYALDIDALVKVGGYGVSPRANALVPPGIPGYWKEAPAYKRDVAKAKQFLATAGYPDGFTCTAVITGSDPVLELMQLQLAEVGITMKIEVVEGGIYWEKLATGTVVCIPSFQTLPDAGYALSWFVTDQYWNTMKWSNAKYDELFKKGQVEIDSKARAQDYIDMQKLMDQDAAIVPIAFLMNGVVYRKAAVDLGLNNQALLPNGVVDLSRVKVK
jgi:peptide/nickel transport system substrate-binding protein